MIDIDALNISLQRERASRRALPLAESPLADGWYLVIGPKDDWPAIWYYSKAGGWNVPGWVEKRYTHWCPFPKVPE